MRFFPLFLLACNGTPSKDGATDGTKDGPDTSDSSGTNGGGYCAVQRAFTHSCVACHSASGNAGGLDIQTDAHAALVGVASASYAGRTLVVAGDSAGSFLTAKLNGSQTSTEGAVMPPSGPMSATDIALVTAWIDAGATTDCGTDTQATDDTAPYRYHPADYAASDKHGMDAKYQRDDCVSCHGADLNGGSVGVSCDSCHTYGWRTDCTFCHGGTDNTTGAPPVDIDNQTTDLAFVAHTAHVSEGDHPAYDCVQCHTKPADVTTAAHFLIGDATPGLAEVTLHGGLSDAGAYSTGSCSNMYCHGNGQGDNGTVTATSTVNCGTCHGVKSTGEASWERLSGEHHKHVNDARLGCETCHGTVVAATDTLIGPTLHVDGTVSVTLPEGMTYRGSTCTGTCHAEVHDGRRW
jgi:predicted CxxxxCH...CXXCH cytochrome family protein